MVTMRDIEASTKGYKKGSTTYASRVAYNPLFKLQLWLNSAKSRAKAKGLEFDIVLDDIDFPRYCPLLGIKLDYNAKGAANKKSPSLDRIDNTKGYTKDNVWVISYKANTMKNNASLKELKLFCKNLQATILKDI